MCGIILEVCRFNTERPLSGLGVENKKKRNHSDHHTPHHHHHIGQPQNTQERGSTKQGGGRKTITTVRQGNQFRGFSAAAALVEFISCFHIFASAAHPLWLELANKLEANKFFLISDTLIIGRHHGNKKNLFAFVWTLFL